MAQVSNANLTHLVDRPARHVLELNGTPIAKAIAAAGVYETTTPTSAGLAVANTDVLAALQTLALSFYADPDQTDDFVPPCVDLYANTPLINQFAYSFFAKLRRALDNHMARYAGNAMIAGDRSPLDAALRVINLSTLLRVHSAFAQYFGDISPANIFTGTPFVLATIAASGATTAVLTHVSSISGIYGPGQIMLLNTKGAGEGGSSVVVTVTCTQNGVAATEIFTTAATTYLQLTATTDTSKTFTDCTALVSIANATDGDTYSVVIVPDRVIYAA